MAYVAPSRGTHNAAAALRYHTRKNGKVREGVISRGVNCSVETAAEEFAAMRKVCGYRKGKGVEAYTDIISFANGEVTMKQALDVACEAYSKAFPNTQFVATAHNDGKGGKVHVHLCKNNIDFATGKKLKTSGTLNLLKSKVNEVCMKHGLSIIELAPVMDTKYRSYSLNGRKRRYTATEKSLHDAGRKSWKDEIRDAIDVAAKKCKSENEFFEVMKNKGIIVTNRAGGYTYRLEGHKAVRGRRLGDDYNEAHLLNAFVDNRAAARRRAAEPPKVEQPKPKPAYKPYKLTEAEKVGMEILRGMAAGLSSREILAKFSARLAEGGEAAHSRFAEASNQISRGKVCLPVPVEFLTPKGGLDASKIKANPQKFAKSMQNLAAKRDGEMIGNMVASLVPIPGLKSLVRKAVSEAAQGVLKASYSSRQGSSAPGGQGLKSIKDTITGQKDSHTQLVAHAKNNEPDDDWIWLTEFQKDEKREEAARARTY